MRRASTVRLLLRAAVQDALAAACAMPLIGCGGSIDRAVAQDAGQAATPPDVHSSIPTNTPEPAQGDASAPPTIGVVDASVSIPEEAAITVQDALGPTIVVLVEGGWAGDAWSLADGSSPGEASVLVDSSLSPDASCGQLLTGSCLQVTLSCLPEGLVIGNNASAACATGCGTNNLGCSVAAVSGATGYTFQCFCGGGRFPAGLEMRAPGKGNGALGTHLARSAALESASVRAFVQLARELATHGAPASLVARARTAGRQETQHARLLRQAAAARGCSVPRLRSRRASTQVRSIDEIAMENAVEGCGRETLGAALLKFQALRASDPALRSVLARIAEDETEHAELAWDLHKWFESRLDSAARERMRAARVAFLAMCDDDGPPTDARVAGPLGLPAPQQWRALIEAVRAGGEELAA